MPKAISPAIARVLQRVGKVRRQSNGWVARCPAHDDRTPSLSIGEGEGGRVLLTCHAGCSIEAVLAALRLDVSELFAPRVHSVAEHPPREVGSPRRSSADDVTYDYVDENGMLLSQVVRRSPKRSAQRRPDGVDGWIPNVHGVRPVVYRLPEVQAAVAAGRPVYIVEGEKDADNLQHLGLTATTNPGGAGKWRSEHSAQLAGATVVILPDNDDAGRSHADAVAESLRPHAQSVRVVALPHLPLKGDVTDWLAGAGTVEELEQLVGAAQERATVGVERSAVPTGLVCLADVAPESVEWVWLGWLPEGTVTLLDGDPGTGKSTLTIELAARLSTGRPLPGAVPRDPVPVLFVANEDSLATTVVPRLDAAGADRRLVHAVTDHLVFPDDFPRLRELMLYTGAKLVVVDPLFNHVAGRINAYKDQDVRQVMSHFAALAAETGAAILLVRHLTKAGTGSALTAGGGSIGIVGAARMAWLAVKHPTDPTRVVLSVYKSNLAAHRTSLSYLIRDAAGVGCLEWDEGGCEYTAEELYQAARAGTAGRRHKREDAAEWLAGMLADGPVPATEVVSSGHSAGHSERTLERAKHEIGAESARVGYSEGGRTFWVLPAHADLVDGIRRQSRAGAYGTGPHSPPPARRADVGDYAEPELALPSATSEPVMEELVL